MSRNRLAPVPRAGLVVLAGLLGACQADPPPLQVVAELAESKVLKVLFTIKSTPGTVVKTDFQVVRLKESFEVTVGATGQAEHLLDLEVASEVMHGHKSARLGKIISGLPNSGFRATGQLKGAELAEVGGRLSPSKVMTMSNQGLECRYPPIRVDSNIDVLKLRVQPEGAELVFQGQTGQEVRPNLLPFLEGVDIVAALKARDEGPAVLLKDVVVRLKDGHEIHGDFPVRGYLLSDWLAESFQTVRENPVLAQVAVTGKAAAVVDEQDTGKAMSVAVLGNAKSIADVGFIVIAAKSTRKLPGCKGYRNSKSGAPTVVSRTAADLTVTVYGRVSGEKLASKVFRGAAPSCGLMYMGPAHDSGKERRRSMNRWLKKWVKKN